MIHPSNQHNLCIKFNMGLRFQKRVSPASEDPA